MRQTSSRSPAPRASQPSSRRASTPVSPTPEQPTRRVDWLNLSFLSAVHVAGLAGLWLYLETHPLTLMVCSIGVVGTVLTVFAISAGYHRLFSHQAYEPGPVFRFFLLVLGAAAFQTSAITWAATHRRHHRFVDTALDPYNAKRGLWYSHVGWALELAEPPTQVVPVTDLEKDYWLSWQHRYTIPIGVVTGFLLPAAVGWWLGDVWGGLLFGGLLRLIATYHLTFSINSLVHKFGSQPYSERNSSRDSHLAALLTMGEGYHNYHHTFPADYRNGARRHQFDPTKWVLRSLECLKITRNLKRTPDHVIARARWRMDQQRMVRQGIPSQWRERLDKTALALNQALSEWSTLSRQLRLAKQAAAAQAAVGSLALQRLDTQLGCIKRRFRQHYAEWQQLLRRLDAERLQLMA